MSLGSDAGKPLQFDTARPANAPSVPSSQDVTCVVCNTAIGEKYYDVNAQTVCDRCRQQLVDQAETPKGLGTFAKATLFGFGAAIAGAILYYAVVKITNLEIGLVAIAIGYMVGYATRAGAGGRGGRRFQVMAIVLTYWAVGLAYMPLAFSAMNQDQKPIAANQSPATPDQPPAELAAAEVAPEADDKPLTAGGFVLAIGALVFLSFALPVLSVIGSMPGGLISAAIIAFGMQQAWRMTAAPQLVITGPYRIARSA